MKKSGNTVVPRVFVKLRMYRQKEVKVESSDGKRPPTEAVGLSANSLMLPVPRDVLIAATAPALPVRSALRPAWLCFSQALLQFCPSLSFESSRKEKNRGNLSVIWGWGRGEEGEQGRTKWGGLDRKGSQRRGEETKEIETGRQATSAECHGVRFTTTQKLY